MILLLNLVFGVLRVFRQACRVEAAPARKVGVERKREGSKCEGVRCEGCNRELRAASAGTVCDVGPGITETDSGNGSDKPRG